MFDRIKNVVVIALATLGVLFIILMLIPDDEEEDRTEALQETIEAEATEETREYALSEGAKEEETEATVTEEASDEEDREENASQVPFSEDDRDEEEPEEETGDEDSGNRAEVIIPDSEISDYKMKFRTSTVDGKIVDQSIFEDYDITIVYVWATYCGNCISEMDEYGAFYKNKPDNVNLVGIVGDVYDGIDSNVKSAENILSDSGAEFMNLAVSDSLYDIAASIQLYPSSFLVDRKGHIIGGLLEGAHYEDTMKVLGEYVSET